MAGKAKGRRTFGTKIKDQTHDIKFLYGLQGSSGSPRASNMSFSFAGGSSTPSSTDEYARLKTQGDTMIGAISYYPKVVTIDGSGEIDVNAGYSGQLDDGYSSYLYLTGLTNPDDLVTIANPSHVGQLLHIETVPELVLKHNTGNIFIPDEADRTIEAGGFVTLLYDGAIHSGKWVLVSTSTAGGGSSSWVGTATSDLDMDTYDITDVCRIEFNQGGDTIDDSVAGIDSSSDKIRFNVPSGDHFHFTVDGDDEVKIDGTDFGIWGYLKFNSHTSGTNQPYQESDGYIEIKIGTSLRKLFFYT